MSHISGNIGSNPREGKKSSGSGLFVRFLFGFFGAVCRYTPLPMDIKDRFPDFDRLMDTHRNTGPPPEPLCKFGPGGDFVSYWPGGHGGLPRPAAGALGSLLSRLAELIRNSNPAAEMPASHNQHPADTEDRKHDDDRPNGIDAASVATAESDSPFSGEPMLFAHDCRTGKRTAHKPKHRIRAHRRAAKKGASASIPGQGTLFEIDFKGAKTA